MDYLTFAQNAKDEIKARLAQQGSQTTQEVLEKFYEDQGFDFGIIDYDKVLALVNEPIANTTTADNTQPTIAAQSPK